MRHSFETEQWIAAPLEQVFAFFTDPYNLPGLMPPWQHATLQQARIVAPPPMCGRAEDEAASIVAGYGSEMLIRFRPAPFSPLQLSWRARISDFVWNSHFCDEQLRGPFAYWRHCHHLLADDRDGVSGTLVRDHLEYALPCGWLGDIVHALFAKRQIAGIFRYRQKTLAKIFGMPAK